MAKKIASVTTTLIIIALLLSLGYFLFQNQKIIDRLSKSASPSPVATTTEAPKNSENLSPSPQASKSAIVASASLTQNSIKTNVNAKNFQGLTPYMTSLIHVSLHATECCGQKTPETAVEQMSYINDAIPFDFNQNMETIKMLKAKSTQLANMYIGISTKTEYLVGFTLDGNNKISEVLMAASWKLFE